MQNNNQSRCELLSSETKTASEEGSSNIIKKESLQNYSKIITNSDQANVRTLLQNPQVNHQISRNQQNLLEPNKEAQQLINMSQTPVNDPPKSTIQQQKFDETLFNSIQTSQSLNQSPNVTANESQTNLSQKTHQNILEENYSAQHSANKIKQLKLRLEKLSVQQKKDVINGKYYSQNWQEFCKEYKFNPKFGYLVNPRVKLEKPEFSQFNSIVQRLSLFKNSQHLREQIKLCPEIKIESFENIEQMLKFRDMLTYTEGRYICLERSFGKKDAEITLPYPLSQYIIQISKFLKIKVGPTVGISSNWSLTQNQNINEESFPELTMQNLKLQYYFSEHKREEHIFLGTSVVASFYLAKVIKNCYNINQIIENEKILSSQKIFLIIKYFEEIQQEWTKIYDLMVSLSDSLDPDTYYHQIRPHLMGFQNLKFQGYESPFTSGGGSAGEDPSYQIFERAMGVEISQAFTRIQVKLRQGMYQSHIDLQDYFGKNSLIKTYCLKNDFLTESYQRVLKTYTKMNCFHNNFIRKYILNYVAAENHPYVKGAGGNNIMDIMNRWKILDEKNSLGMRPSHPNNSI